MAFKVEGKHLYAVPIEKLDRRGQPIAGSGQIYHINAGSAGEALNHFRIVFPNRRTHRIVGASECIGFFVANKQGTIVSAT